MERLTIDEEIVYVKEVAEKMYAEAMLCHSNTDGLLDRYIESAKKHEQLAEWLEELKVYKDAEEQGLMLRLPCKVGDTVWFVGNDFVNNYEVRRYIVDETGIDYLQVAKEIDRRDYWNSFSIDEIDKTVFISEEKAKQALKQIKYIVDNVNN